MILVSRNLGNTLIVEWTQNDLVDHKRKQIERYSKISERDLIEIAAVPPDVAKAHDILLILCRDHVSRFKEFLASKGRHFPILIFEHQKGEYVLSKVEYDFAEKETDDFFTKGIHIQKIPLRYLPFPLDQISHVTLVSFVVRHLTSSLVKGVREITIEDFCSGYVPVWDLISDHIKRGLMKCTKEILNDLVRTVIGRELLTRIGNNPPAWKLADGEIIRRRLRSLRKSLNQFISEQKGEPYQPELF